MPTKTPACGIYGLLLIYFIVTFSSCCLVLLFAPAIAVGSPGRSGPVNVRVSAARPVFALGPVVADRRARHRFPVLVDAPTVAGPVVALDVHVAAIRVAHWDKNGDS